MNADHFGKALIALFNELEHVVIENCALREVLKKAERMNGSSSSTLAEQVSQLVLELRYGHVHVKFEHFRERIQQAVEEDRLSDLFDLTEQATDQIN